MAASQGFFRNIGSQEELALAYEKVGDCGFQALAVWLLLYFDNYLILPRAKVVLINTLLDRHFIYFPQHEPSKQNLRTPMQCMKYLKENVPLIVSALAYTLKRIAFDELCRDPARYRGAFIKLKQSNLEALFQNMPFDDHSALALTQALKFRIDVQDETSSKPIYALRLYQSHENPAATVTIRKRDDEYYLPCDSANIPFIKSVKKSKAIARQDIPEQNQIEICKLLDNDAALLYKHYEHAYNDLLMTSTTKKVWLNVFIKLVAGNSDEPRLVSRSGTEHGNQQLFLSLQDENQDVRGTERYDEHLVIELKKTIARAVALNEISLDHVYDFINEESQSFASKNKTVF